MSTAGKLTERVAFDKRVDVEDGHGNTVDDFVEQFRCWAEYKHIRGGESVMQSRLDGKHVQVIRVRASTQVRVVTTDWRIRDTRTEVEFNIRDITFDTSRAWLDFLVDGGGASG